MPKCSHTIEAPKKGQEINHVIRHQLLKNATYQNIKIKYTYTLWKR